MCTKRHATARSAVDVLKRNAAAAMPVIVFITAYVGSTERAYSRFGQQRLVDSGDEEAFCRTSLPRSAELSVQTVLQRWSILACPPSMAMKSQV